MNPNFFYPATILLPKKTLDQTAFSVVACDQYTSQPDYWQAVQVQTAQIPSAYHLVFPEIELENDGFDEKIASINQHMSRYLQENVFDEYPNSMFYVERKLKNNAIRKGLIGMIDLEQYDYQKEAENYIRATEGTVLERIPPRVTIRENALLELPHVMLLLDDEAKQIIEPLAEKTTEMELLYDFPFMMDSGSCKGYRLTNGQQSCVTALLEQQSSSAFFNQKYGVSDRSPLLFAVGDGNHSLATAKACYTKLKQRLSPEEAAVHPARYALVELVNLHDESLEFEAIHRVLFQVSAADLLAEIKKHVRLQEGFLEDAQTFTLVENGMRRCFSILNPVYNLAVGSIQPILDEFLQTNGGKIDYIHGEDVVMQLCSKPENTGILFPCMEKSDLFKTVILDGALPRKTFSMGEACDKRFYLEARKIR